MEGCYGKGVRLGRKHKQRLTEEMVEPETLSVILPYFAAPLSENGGNYF